MALCIPRSPFQVRTSFSYELQVTWILGFLLSFLIGSGLALRSVWTSFTLEPLSLLRLLTRTLWYYARTGDQNSCFDLLRGRSSMLFYLYASDAALQLMLFILCLKPMWRDCRYIHPGDWRVVTFRFIFDSHSFGVCVRAPSYCTNRKCVLLVPLLEIIWGKTKAFVFLSVMSV